MLNGRSPHEVSNEDSLTKTKEDKISTDKTMELDRTRPEGGRIQPMPDDPNWDT